ncbi:MAG: signal transduction histidine kinase [Candidatus Midichloriaceae bacterium]|jgi:signal transduction histidine kinase
MSEFNKANFHKLLSNVDHSKYYMFAMLYALFCIPYFMFFSSSEFDEYWILKYNKIIGAWMCIILCMHEWWAVGKVKKFLIYYWNICLMICLSVFTAYPLFLSGFHYIEIVNYLLSIILLTIFTNWQAFSFLVVVGALISYVYFLISVTIYKSDIQHLFVNYYNIHTNLYLSYSAVVAFVLIAFFIYKLRQDEKVERKTLETFGYSIAHELKTPLSIIKMQAEMHDMFTKEEMAKNMKDVAECGLQEADMILGMLTLTKELKDSKISSLTYCVKQAIDEYYFVEKKDRDRVSISENNKDFEVNISYTLIKHIIHNLLKNALKYSGTTSKIDIRCDSDTNNLYFSDDGIGISHDILNTLFKRFHKSSQSGYGIGLNFCKEGMNLIGGDIEYNFNRKKGTEFILLFKL